jgi:hypothetical protein
MAEVPPQRPAHEKVYQTPEWETPVYPPKRSPFGRFNMSKPSLTKLRSENAHAREDEAATQIPSHSSSLNTESQKISNAHSRRSRRAALQARFDAVLPPHKKYFGRTRRWFLLVVVLPIVVFLVLILPIALGVGLSKKSPKKLPLPKDTSVVYTGDLTFYAPALGACGWNSSDTEHICAVSHELWDALEKGKNPNTNPLCGMRIRVQRDFVEEAKGMQSVEVTVVDRCTGCKPTVLDLSPKVYNGLAREEDGIVVGSWSWVDTL